MGPDNWAPTNGPRQQGPDSRAPTKGPPTKRRAKRTPANRAPDKRAHVKRAPVKRAPDKRTLVKRTPVKRTPFVEISGITLNFQCNIGSPASNFQDSSLPYWGIHYFSNSHDVIFLIRQTPHLFLYKKHRPILRLTTNNRLDHNSSLILINLINLSCQ